MTEEHHYSRNGFLTSRGHREVAQRTCDHLGVDAMTARLYLDKVGSVSGLRRDEIMEDLEYDPLHIELNAELLNGS